MNSYKQRRDEAELTAFYLACGLSLPVIQAAIEVRRGAPVNRSRSPQTTKRKKQIPNAATSRE